MNRVWELDNLILQRNGRLLSIRGVFIKHEGKKNKNNGNIGIIGSVGSIV